MQQYQQLVHSFEEALHHSYHPYFDVHHFEKIIAYYQQAKKYKKAFEAVTCALHHHHYSADLLGLKAQVLLDLRKAKAALRVIEQAINLSPSIENYLIQALALRDLHEYTQATPILLNILTDNTSNATERSDAYFYLAHIYDAQNDLQQAYDCIVRCLEHNNNHTQALLSLNYFTSLSARYDESINLYKKIIDEYPYTYEAWQGLGDAYFGLGLYEKAIDAYEFVVAIDDTYVQGYISQAEAYFELANFAKSAALYLIAMKHNPDFVQEISFSYNLGLCYYNLKDYDKAINYFAHTIKSDESFANAYYQIASCYEQQGLVEDALVYYKHALKFNGNDKDYLMAVANAYMVMGKISSAIPHYTQLVTDYPKNVTFAQLLSYAYIVQDEIPTALQIIERSNQQFQDAHEAVWLYLKAACFVLSGQKQEGIAIFERAFYTNKSLQNLFFDIVPYMKRNPMVCQILGQE